MRLCRLNSFGDRTHAETVGKAHDSLDDAETGQSGNESVGASGPSLL